LPRKLFVLITVLVLISFTISGCGLLDKILSIKEDFQKADAELEEGVGEQSEEIDVESPPIVPELVIAEENIEFKNVVLYFGSSDGQHLVAIEKEIPKTEGIARATINALIEGPDFQSGLLPTIPAGTELLDINVKEDGLCIVDFSQELVTNLPGGEINEKLAVYSIVNTLCQFPTIDRVEFRVQGQRMDTLLGYVNLAPAIVASTDIVQEID